MCFAVNRALQRRKLRAAVLAAVAALTVLVGSAHSGAGMDHMVTPAAMCLAIAAVAAAGAAAGPRLGRLLADVPRPRDRRPLTMLAEARLGPQARARGHPAELQVFRL